MVSHARYGRLLPINDPFSALQRDSRSATLLGVPSSDDAALLKAVTEGPMMALEAVVVQHRNSHVKLIQAMQDAEARHNKVNICGMLIVPLEQRKLSLHPVGFFRKKKNVEIFH